VLGPTYLSQQFSTQRDKPLEETPKTPNRPGTGDTHSQSRLDDSK
jgi:hypothetical protein